MKRSPGLVLLVALLFAGAATAPPLSIRGTVVDGGAAPVRGVLVTAVGSNCTGSQCTAGTISNGIYTVTVPNTTAYTVTPSKSGCTFTPTDAAASGGDSGVDFVADCTAATPTA